MSMFTDWNNVLLYLQS